ncbi:MAG: PH domain-containing protein [Fimbriimonas sp.]
MEDANPPILAEGQPQKLHPAIRKVWQISTLFGGLVLAVLLGIPEYFITRRLDSWPLPFPMIGPGLGLLKTIFGWFMAGRQYEQWTYALREHDLVLTHGVLWRTRRCVARDRVQHLDVNSGPLDRRFGLVQVSIYAAGALGGIGSIPGMTPEAAEALRAALLERTAADA